MIIYIGLAIAVIALFGLTFLNTPVFGSEPDPNNLKNAENFKLGIFHNQSVTETLTNGGTFFKILKEWINKAKNNVPANILPVVKTDLKNFHPNEPTIIWFGHSSYLIFIEGKTVLVDPVFHKASPVPIFGKPFPMDYNYNSEDFPRIDFLLITHDHYDHLDYQAFKALLPKVEQIVTSAGVEAHLQLWGAKENQIAALLWNQSIVLNDFQFTALPARHFSGRKFKRANTLWSSFALKTANYNLYLGGDSGFDKHFEEIGKNYGPFDLAILECGQYGKYWANIHMMPEEVVTATKQLNAKILFPVHWAKFALSTHSWTEPIERLIIEAEKQNLTILTPRIGEPFNFSDKKVFEKWWEKI